MIYEYEAGSLRQGRQQRVDDGIRGLDGKRNVGDHNIRARPVRRVLESVATGVVDVIDGQQLVARFEWKRSHNGIDARRRVGDEDEIGRVSSDQSAQPGPGFVDCRLEGLEDEAGRIRLHE